MAEASSERRARPAEKRRLVWEVGLATRAAVADAIGKVLGRVFGAPPVIQFHTRRRRTTVSVFLTERPTARAVRYAAEQLERRLRGGGGVGAAGRLTVRPLPPQDWAESWKRHFRPLEIGRALLIRAGWHRRRPRRGQALLVLDPGLSFGTGQHATTRFCLRQMVARRVPGQQQSLLDVGTGSGILALAAVKLGYAPVHAFDRDAEAVRVARANARRNHIRAGLRLWRQDLARLPRRPARRYELVCANLDAAVLLARRKRLADLLRPGGTLLLAGVLQREFARVRAAYAALGLRLRSSQREGAWRSGAFERTR